MENQRGDVPPREQRTFSGVEQIVNDAETESLYGRFAWHVAERMLQTLGRSNAPKGFKPGDFVKESFETTFDGRVPAHPLERKWPDKLKVPIGCSVVDVALGTMGYGSTAICDEERSHLISIFTSSVKSNVSCGSYSASVPYPGAAFVGRKTTQKEDLLRNRLCTQTISTNGFLQMVECCTPVLSGVCTNGRQVLQILDAILSAAVNISVVTPYSEACHLLYQRAFSDVNSSTLALRSLITYAREEQNIIYSKLEPCSRLKIWRLYPHYLKEDLSRLARYAMDHPLLCLKEELHNREEWTILVACLMLAPDVFGEARRLLHAWFLATSVKRLLELRAELVSALCSALSNPSAWGFAEEVHLPPQHAFFSPHFRHLIVILGCSPTIAGLTKIVDLIDHQESVDARLDECQLAEQGCTCAGSVIENRTNTCFNSCHDHHDSLWAQLIDFVPWLQFACRVLFRKNQRKAASESPQEDTGTKTANGTERVGRREPKVVAARYIARTVKPLHSRLRSSTELMLLQSSKDWDRVLEMMCDDQHFKQLPSHCSRCGVLLCDLKKQTTEDMNETSCSGGNEAKEATTAKGLSALDAWLADLRANFKQTEQSPSVANRNTDDDEKENVAGFSMPSHSSLSNSDWQQKLLCTKLLPLGALIESLPRCSFRTIYRMVQFVSYESNLNFRYREGQDAEASTCSVGCSIVHCNNCCPEQNRQSSRFGVQSQGRRAESENCLESQDRQLSDWISGASAIFDFLDVVQADAQLSRPAISDSNAQTAIAWNVVHKNMAVIISRLVMDWVNLSETSSSSVLLLGSLKEGQVASLQDLRSRFDAWLGKLQLSPASVAHCALAKEVLDERIAHLQSLLISSQIISSC